VTDDRGGNGAGAGAGAPPGAPWLALADRGGGYLSAYYSEPLARYPVRQLTRPADNKSDPNIETRTYGLFSTCEPPMRNKIVTEGRGTVLFVTSHAGRQRAIAGYYRIGWYTEGTRGAARKDWALAASAARWVDPLPLASATSAVPAAAGWFRTCKPLDADAVAALVALIDEREDRSEHYLAELRRIEQFARSRTGFAYPSWGRTTGFSWHDAHDYFHSPGAADAPNSSPSKFWLCRECRRVICNAALLKVCPACRSAGTLEPHLKEAS